ncbi:MAG: leucine-rich repeat domain-containing protein [Candidatus Thorarchaeota archaeon]|nr:leucine-rich repeat domain-containing protein [Candidatus Thorarchaeota archaeon]
MPGLSIIYESAHGRQEEQQVDPARIDLRMRAVTNVDLEVVRGNAELEVIELSKNQLDSIELSPLEECTKLERIRLRSNRLHTLNLWPLMQLPNLEEIDLVDNQLKEVNVTPLVGKCRILLDDTTKVTIDSVLRYLVGGKETTQFQLCKSSGDELATSPRIFWNDYSYLAKPMDWSQINFNTLSLIETIEPRCWFRAQKGFLEGMGIPELAGFDGDPSLLINDSEDALDFESARNSVFDRTMVLLEEQLQEEGPTLFLDVQQMARSRASKLIPLVAELRDREMKNVILPVGGNSVHLLPLWQTHYGMELLRVLRYGLTTDTEGLALLTKNLESLRFNLGTKEIDVGDNQAPKRMSDGLLDYIYSMASMNYTDSRIQR